jgi:hypothetical protein
MKFNYSLKKNSIPHTKNEVLTLMYTRAQIEIEYSYAYRKK